MHHCWIPSNIWPCFYDFKNISLGNKLITPSNNYVDWYVVVPWGMLFISWGKVYLEIRSPCLSLLAVYSKKAIVSSNGNVAYKATPVYLENRTTFWGAWRRVRNWWVENVNNTLQRIWNTRNETLGHEVQLVHTSHRQDLNQSREQGSSLTCLTENRQDKASRLCSLADIINMS